VVNGSVDVEGSRRADLPFKGSTRARFVVSELKSEAQEARESHMIYLLKRSFCARVLKAHTLLKFSVSNS
jgi:hypothetical protein